MLCIGASNRPQELDEVWYWLTHAVTHMLLHICCYFHADSCVINRDMPSDSLLAAGLSYSCLRIDACLYAHTLTCTQAARRRFVKRVHIPLPDRSVYAAIRNTVHAAHVHHTVIYITSYRVPEIVCCGREGLALLIPLCAACAMHLCSHIHICVNILYIYPLWVL